MPLLNQLPKFQMPQFQLPWPQRTQLQLPQLPHLPQLLQLQRPQLPRQQLSPLTVVGQWSRQLQRMDSQPSKGT